MLGKFLCPTLTTQGYEVIKLLRRRVSPRKPDVSWSPGEGWIDCDKLGSVDAVIHLSGENIANGKWTPERRQAILDSRVESTSLIAAAMVHQQPHPKVVICASAVGFYGNRGDEILTEESAPGEGFLPEVCQRWENAASPLREAGVRTVHLRFGMLLSGHGGAMQKMLPIFRFGLGGRLGSGRQYMSWCGIRDAVRAIHHILQDSQLSGPVNVTAPEPITNREFTRELARAVGRPSLLPVPSMALRTLYGDMADEMLLASTRAIPQRLEKDGFTFNHPYVASAIRSSLHHLQ